jgi:hypothetical protein
LRAMLKLEDPDRERGRILQGMGERLRMPSRGAISPNGSTTVNRATNTAAGADAKPSRSA